MIDIIAQRPFMLSFILAAIAIAAFWGWMQTGKRAAIIVGAIFTLLIPVGIVVERLWVTDQERLLATIYQAADALQANDYDTVYQFVAPEAKHALVAARAELPRYEFHEVTVNPGSFRKIQINYDLNPPEAIVDFSAKAVVSVRGGQVTRASVPRRLIVRFRKLGERWCVVEYTHLPVVGGADTFSPNGGRLPAF